MLPAHRFGVCPLLGVSPTSDVGVPKCVVTDIGVPMSVPTVLSLEPVGGVSTLPGDPSASFGPWTDPPRLCSDSL